MPSSSRSEGKTLPDEQVDELTDDDETWVGAPPFVPSHSAVASDASSKFHGHLRKLSDSEDPLLANGVLGRFLLRRRIGAGGMGTVYAAFDPLHDRSVAIKILHSALNQQSDVLRRFQRESRLLAEINSEYVTKLFEIGDDHGQIYFVQELVDGQSLAELIKTSGALTESQAIGISVDVAMALAALHSHGIVHRDVKPENVLICVQNSSESGVASTRLSAKLTDLGIARQEHVNESVVITAAESLLGTPLYMSPEHFYGGAQVNELSDVYSLGATLYHALTGAPPFRGDSALALADSHRHQPLPSPQTVNKRLSDGVCEVVLKAMQKRPDLRYASARELLDDLQKLQRGEVTSVLAHPLLPDLSTGRLATFSYSWELSCSPEQLWPYVSNTERLNRAINLPAVQFSIQQVESTVRRQMAEVRFAGMRMQWQEHAFEWIEGRRMSVLREFQRGPLRWMTSVVQLHRRADGGTTLTHSFKASCRHIPGLLFIKFQMNAVTRRALDRVYRRIDTVLQNRHSSNVPQDAFEETRPLKTRAHRLLEQITQRMSRQNVDQAALLKVTDYVRSASAQDVSRIRPRALARILDLPPDKLIDICLRGVPEGLFEIKWDVICPSCRIAAQTQDSIANIRKHERCEACDFDFEVDFATSVELILRASANIRDSESGQFCIGGPAHSPHVVSQTRVAPEETVQLGLELSAGRYVLRGPQLPFSIQLIVTPESGEEKMLVNLSERTTPNSSIELRTDRQLITIVNPGATEIVLRIERTATSDDALTALQAASMPFFKRTFPNEIPTAMQVASVASFTFVVIANSIQSPLADRFGELRSCDLLKDHLEKLIEFAARFGGSFVRPHGEGGLLAFRTADSANQALPHLHETIPLADNIPAWVPVIAVQHGPVMLTTLNGQIEYVGSTVLRVQKLADKGTPGEIAH